MGSQFNTAIGSESATSRGKQCDLYRCPSYVVSFPISQVLCQCSGDLFPPAARCDLALASLLPAPCTEQDEHSGHVIENRNT